MSNEIQQQEEHVNSCQIELALLHKRLIELNEEVAEKITQDESEEAVEAATELFHKITDLVKNIRFQERILKDRTSALSIALMAQEVNKSTAKTVEKYQWFSKDKLQDYAIGLAKDAEKTPDNMKYLRKLVDGNVHLKPLLKIENECVFEDLIVKFPNFEEVTRFYQAQFRLARLTGNIRIAPAILLGAPGIGKTKYAKALAEILKTGFTFVDMASLTGPWVLTGINATWQNAKQGKFLEAMVKSPTASPIFLLDE
ncbi:MAG TPA: AAA family ATPase, partial [Anaerovoracaceae bacterium]|nr:AAA family ATPase [Anaerovoracaceae bacterium]